MKQAHNQQAAPSPAVQASQMKAAGKGRVGSQDQDRPAELNQSAVNACYLTDPFVHQDHGGVEDGGAQAEEDPRQIGSGSVSSRADDQHQSDGGHDKADKLPHSHLFVKQNGTCGDDDHRGEIVAEGGQGDGGVAVGLKKENPVDAHGHAGD